MLVSLKIFITNSIPISDAVDCLNNCLRNPFHLLHMYVTGRKHIFEHIQTVIREYLLPTCVVAECCILVFCIF